MDVVDEPMAADTVTTFETSGFLFLADNTKLVIVQFQMQTKTNDELLYPTQVVDIQTMASQNLSWASALITQEHGRYEPPCTD